MDKFIQALKSLLGSEVEFSIDDHDLSSITFQKGEAKIPTIKQIEAEVTRMENALIAEEAAKVARKQEIATKLGLTAEEVSALLA
jgi:hypothetical protein